VAAACRAVERLAERGSFFSYLLWLLAVALMVACSIRGHFSDCIEADEEAGLKREREMKRRREKRRSINEENDNVY